MSKIYGNCTVDFGMEVWQIWHAFPTTGTFQGPNQFVVLLPLSEKTPIPFCDALVQSLNSPFFPPHVGAEPGRAKEESRITCMRMLRTPPFFPPKSGEKTIFGSILQIWLVARFWIF